jgi:hypothetical protein
MLRRKGEGRRHNQLTNAAACGRFGASNGVTMHERQTPEAKSLKTEVAQALSPLHGRSAPLCAMNPRMAMDCVAWARMSIAAWSMPVAAQNKITLSCALSSVVGFAMVYSRPPDCRPSRNL